MIKTFKIDKNSKIPVYQQIMDTVIEGIEQGVISEGDQIPSINLIANEQKLARETVVKAFKLLQQKGIIKPIHGKGYFVSTQQLNIQHRVFILLDTLSAYKEVLYQSIQESFGDDAFLDVYFHHYNPKVFQQLIQEAAGNYTSYIVLPFDHVRSLNEVLNLVPHDKLYIIDQKPDSIPHSTSGIYQDFKQDVLSGLSKLHNNLKKYRKLILLFRNTNTIVPLELKEGFKLFCEQKKVNHEIIESYVVFTPQKGEAFLVIDNEDLVFLVEYSTSEQWTIGKDIGILSYNDTSLKKVVAGGITVISTDFRLMGRTIADMIQKMENTLIANPSHVIDRGSF